MRIVGPPAAVAACNDWATDYVLASTTRDPSRQEHVLGVDFGETHAPATQFRRATEAVSELHEALAQVEDTASELILLRKCADACKVVHLLRASGPSIDPAALGEYDSMLRRSLARCLGGELDDLSAAQCAVGVSEGGLGVRRAAATALPAFVASRVESRWLVDLLAQGVSETGVGPEGMLAAYDASTEEAQLAFEASLPAAAATRARDLAQQAAEARGTPEAALAGARRRRESALAGDDLVLPAGAEDAEFEPASLQAALCAIQDELAVARLLEQLDAPALLDRRRRLLELRDPSVSHEWLWRVSRAHGPVVPRSDFQVAVRLRVGAVCTSPAAICARCGAALGATGSHALCCALPEATRGHYDVRDEVLRLGHLADPTAATEALGLIPTAPTLRPADILTSAALPGRLAALDRDREPQRNRRGRGLLRRDVPQEAGGQPRV